MEYATDGGPEDGERAAALRRAAARAAPRGRGARRSWRTTAAPARRTELGREAAYR